MQLLNYIFPLFIFCGSCESEVQPSENTAGKVEENKIEVENTSHIRSLSYQEQDDSTYKQMSVNQKLSISLKEGDKETTLRGYIYSMGNLMFYTVNNNHDVQELIYLDKDHSPLFWGRFRQIEDSPDDYLVTRLGKFTQNIVELIDTTNIRFTFNYESLSKLYERCNSLSSNVLDTLNMKSTPSNDLPLWYEFESRYYITPMQWNNKSLDTLKL